MTGINNNINGTILSSQKVKKEDASKVLEEEKKLARVDGNNNVILVNEGKDGNVSISNIKLDEKEDVSSLKLGQKATVGNATGVISFIDNKEDDAVYQKLDSQKTNPKATPAGKSDVKSFLWSNQPDLENHAGKSDVKSYLWSNQPDL